MATRENLIVTVSLDVEEEGLFNGRYRCCDLSLRNIAYLERLEPLFERGIRPTLFCAYPVLASPECRKLLEKLRPRAEIGVHLHHWNTPPIASNIPDSGELHSVPACEVPIQCLDAKLDRLVSEATDFLGEKPVSFRMGRWDLHRAIFPLLLRHGLLCDASVRPLHYHLRHEKGPDHFCAPSDPYWIDLPEGSLFELPLTVAPLFAPLAFIPGRFGWSRHLRASLRHWGALALLPVQHPLWLMKLTTWLHVSTGGRALSLTWHSSELMPGGTPHLPDQPSVDWFVKRLIRYLDWLEATFNVKYATASEARKLNIWPHAEPRQNCDWNWSNEIAD